MKKKKTANVSESAKVTVTVIPKHSWDEKMTAIKKGGIRMAKEMREQGHKFGVEILAPREVRGGDSVPLSGIIIGLDWKIATKLEMVESARDLITKAYMLGSLDSALPTVLTSVIKGKGLYEYGIGEFFLLYGKFQQQYRLTDKDTRTKMGGSSKRRQEISQALQDSWQGTIRPAALCGKEHPVPCREQSEYARPRRQGTPNFHRLAQVVGGFQEAVRRESPYYVPLRTWLLRSGAVESTGCFPLREGDVNSRTASPKADAVQAS